MPGLFDGTPLERPVTCRVCERPIEECDCPRGVDGEVLRPCDQSTHVRREKRRNGKVVTTVAGLDPVASDLAALLRAFRTRCSAGGTISADGVIEVQGDHRETVAAILRDAGYPVKGELT